MRAGKSLVRLLTIIVASVVLSCGLDDVVLRDLPVSNSPDVGTQPPTSSDDAADGSLGSGAFGVFTGQYFTCALMSGAAFCWGSNVQGALATGDLENRTTPTRVASGIAFDKLSGGEGHACGLETTTGRVLCWGGGQRGQLGLGDTRDSKSPQTVPLSLTALRMSTGYRHTCTIMTDGALFCWGDNAEGALGLSDADGSADLLRPTRVGDKSDWLRVSGGQGHTCGIRSPGTLWCWGRNTNGQLGLGAAETAVQVRTPTRVGTFDDWTELDLGQDAACGLRRDGSLWCWGSAAFLRASPDAGAVFTPTRVGTESDWRTVSLDAFSACGIKEGGALYCWGRNIEGQLGFGDATDRSSPALSGSGRSWESVSVGRFHVCGSTTDHVVHCAGTNDSGQIGVPDMPRGNTFLPVLSPNAVR